MVSTHFLYRFSTHTKQITTINIKLSKKVTLRPELGTPVLCCLYKYLCERTFDEEVFAELTLYYLPKKYQEVVQVHAITMRIDYVVMSITTVQCIASLMLLFG